MIDNYVERHPKRCLAVTSLGMPRYLSAMKYATAVIGNSSSGIIEAPSFKVPTVNIGDRQKGRVRAESVMDCEPATYFIKVLIKKAISPEFQEVLKFVKNPYEQAGTAARIVETITLFRPTELMKKSFFNLGMTEFL
jgi:UDP-N-acetylglucosamine 2-epimerase